MAEPPHMDEPTPTRVEILLGICITLLRIYATISAIEIVVMMIGKERFPISRITDKFNPNPSSITAYCNIFFDVN